MSIQCMNTVESMQELWYALPYKKETGHKLEPVSYNSILNYIISQLRKTSVQKL